MASPGASKRRCRGRPRLPDSETIVRHTNPSCGFPMSAPSSVRRLGSPAAPPFVVPTPQLVVGRRKRVGDPFSPAGCIVPKPLELVSSVDHGLPHPARRLLNVLLAASWPDLENCPDAVFKAVAADVRRAAGWRARDNRQLFAVARALTKTPVALPLLRASADAPIPGFPLLSTARPSQERHCLQFAFASPLAPQWLCTSI